MKEHRAPAAARVSAAIAVLDRGWGKPQQAIEMDWRQKSPDQMTDEELIALIREMESLTRTYLYGPAVCCKPDVSDGGIGLAHLYPARE